MTSTCGSGFGGRARCTLHDIDWCAACALSPLEPGVVAHRVWKWKRWEGARVVLAWAARARDPGVGGSRTGTVTLTLTSTYRTELDLCLLL